MSLDGIVISFTGKLKGCTRAEATAKVKAAGGTITSTVTKKTTHLVVGGDAKLEKAKDGVVVWTEEEFNQALQGDKKGKKKGKAGKKETPVKEEKPAPKKGKKRGKKEEEEQEEEEAPVKEEKPAPMKGKKRGMKEEVEEEEEKPKQQPKKKVKVEKQEKAEPAAAPAAPATGKRVVRKPDVHLASRDQFAIVDDFHTDLMQTNLGAQNNNKFYVIQLLQSTKSKTYSLFTRWGRLGDVGQQQLVDCGNDFDKAIKLFEKKFKDKTKNNWSDRHEFVKHPMQYQLVELDETESGEGGGGDAAMGKLSAGQIHKGQAVLEEIKAILEKKQKGNITELSGKYYSLIPTLSGRQRPPPLDSIALIEEKEAMLDFWLRMGFDDMEEQKGLAPIEGIMDLPLPSTLLAAASGITQAAAIKQCQNRGAELVKQNAGPPVKPMDKELYGSIVLYTGNWIYAQLNSCLRSENRQSIRKYFNYLRVFLEAMCRMPQKEQTLWRGISVDLFDAYEEDKVITWWGVSSCTSDENVALNFISNCGGSCTLLRVRCKTAMDISVLSMFPSEKECLLAPGTQLKVLKRVRNGKISEIDVEEVGRAI
ncbi:Poly [ADP-ribose] polymerase 3 [Aphanomyces cochlioides]|nr:Poly [ADP-ribose] polymerase 3 [Aphanomyces cochlioides]